MIIGFHDKMQFQRLPHEINRSIGSFLDYNSRVEFSRVLPTNHDKFVRKLKSDEHNFYVAKTRINDYLRLSRKVFAYPKKRLYIYQLFKYLATHPDTIVLDVADQYQIMILFDFKEHIIFKAEQFTDPNSDHYGHIMTRKQQHELVSIATKLVERYTNYVPKKILDIKPEKVVIE